MIELNRAATNLVRRPVDGQVITASGRNIPQPPWIFPDDPASAAAYAHWLLEQGREEAAAQNDEWMICRLKECEAREVDGALRELLTDFLFGRPDTAFEAREISASSAGE